MVVVLEMSGHVCSYVVVKVLQHYWVNGLQKFYNVQIC